MPQMCAASWATAGRLRWNCWLTRRTCPCGDFQYLRLSQICAISVLRVNGVGSEGCLCTQAIWCIADGAKGKYTKSSSSPSH